MNGPLTLLKRELRLGGTRGGTHSIVALQHLVNIGTTLRASWLPVARDALHNSLWWPNDALKMVCIELHMAVADFDFSGVADVLAPYMEV